MRKAMVLGALALAGTLASPAFADDFSGFRLGLTLSDDKLVGSFDYTPLAATDNVNSNRFGYGVFGGWALNKYLAVEAGLRGGGDFTDDVFQDTLGAGGNFKQRTSLLAVDASVVGSFWITNNISIFGRAGFYGWKSEVSYVVVSPETRDEAEDEGFAPLFGVGFQSQLDGALVRLEYQQADIGDVAFGPGFGLRDSTFSSLALSIVWIL